MTSIAAHCRLNFAGAVASALLCALVGVSQAQTTTADIDGNGLIEITSLGQLNALRHDLDGDGTPTGPAGDQAVYRTAFGLADGANNSCAGDCEGYELTGDLDFDVNGDGRTWSRSGDSYRLDSEDRQADYFPVDGDGAGGWRPIGDNDNPFAAVFEGNSHTISNLAVRTDTAYIGLFGVIGAGAVIRNLGLIDNLADYTGSSDGNRYIGGLVGWQSGGSITASYATGPADGGDGNDGEVGGLVGRQSGGSITASYATGPADGGDGNNDSAGGLVGRQSGGSITASYATGPADGGDGNDGEVGGLVGRQSGGSITASYATGPADGGDGNDGEVGGLVGRQSGGSITASYATGAADGGDGNNHNVGGLVGWQSGGSITASYATGDANGRAGDGDRVGGLVGSQEDGSIRASYATGDANGRAGDGDRVGGLVGSQGDGSITASYATGDADGGDGAFESVDGLVGWSNLGSIRASYGFGRVVGGEYRGVAGTPPEGVSRAAQLTAANAGTAWNAADSYTLGAWDFGTGSQIPALKYADYDDTGSAFNCNQFPAGACTRFLPGQTEVSAGDSSVVQPGLVVTLVGSIRFGRVSTESLTWSWQQLQGPEVTLGDAGARETSFTAPQPAAGREPLVFRLTATASNGDQYADRVTIILLAPLVDEDGDGLIEIDDLTLLYDMGLRHKLIGTTYEDSAAVFEDATGCPASGCIGYELTRDLDFDRDGDGAAWSGTSSLGYSLDQDDSMAPYFEVDAEGGGGWQPVGAGENPFVAVFDGNSHTISNLAVRRGQAFVGLFGAIGEGAAIRNLGLVDNLADYTGSSEGHIYIGGLVGQQNGGSITASYATGAADGGGGGDDHVGGLVGQQESGTISASYATGAADGGDGDFDVVGGLVGWQERGTISLSYATGAADGGGGALDFVGGLVGRQQRGTISLSYATGAADGGHGDGDLVGGLVGWQQRGIISASYATGAAAGGGGNLDSVGGLVGLQSNGSMIAASYARGAADGGEGEEDRAGGLVGWQLDNSIITASYSTGAAAGGGGGGDRVGGLVGWQEGGSITASYATGAAAGGKGGDDAAGGLVGERGTGTITVSYGFGEAMGERNQGSDGFTKPAVPGGSETITSATQLTAEVAGSAWNAADSHSLGAWDFGDGSQIPALNYADYDGSGAVFDCDQFPAGACGALLPGQDSLSAGEPPAAGLEFGATATLTGSVRFGRVQILSWSWRQLSGPEVALSGADSQQASFTAPVDRDPLVFELTAVDSEGRRYSDRISLVVNIPADLDGDGLLEIHNLTDLHNMRYNLAGTSYSTGTVSAGDSSGCPQTGCVGYELMQDLDFDADGDGATWSGDSEGGYRLDPDDHHPDYFPVDENGAGGWRPIVGGLNPFAAVFEGNGHTISNLAIRRNGFYIGLFGRIGGGVVGQQVAFIRNLGLVDNLADYTGSSDEEVFIGGLVGRQETGTISASYATGAADGGDGDFDQVGGLVGRQERGTISASYATGAADGGDGADDYVGGLVGWQEGGTISLSYATGAADGGGGASDQVGGLVGAQSGTIILSYATGTAAGGDGDGDAVGGLVGRQSAGSIRASYATGAAAGGDGAGDAVGGLVGRQFAGSIRASYATGAAAGGDNVGGSESSQEGSSISAGSVAGPATGGDNIGGLVGWQEGGSIRASYATGEAVGGAGNDVVGALVGVQYGTIRSSYARGHARGGAGDDVVGALVGELLGGRGTGSIVASYASGHASGGEGDDSVGALLGAPAGGGQITASIIASYGFGQVDGGESFGSQGTPLPEGVEEAADLTRDNAGQGWSDIDWDFGTSAQFPALAHNGTLLPGQGRGGSGGSSSGGGGGGSLNPLALALLALPFLPGLRRRPIPHQ